MLFFLLRWRCVRTICKLGSFQRTTRLINCNKWLVLFLLVIKYGTRKKQQTKENQFQSSMSELVVIEKILLAGCSQFYLEIVLLEIKTAWDWNEIFVDRTAWKLKSRGLFFGLLTFRAWIFRHCRLWSLKMSLASRRKGQYILAGKITCCVRKIPSSMSENSVF